MSNKLEIDILLNDKAALAKLRNSLHRLEGTSKRSVDSMNLGWTALAGKIFVAQQAFHAVSRAMNATVGKSIEFEKAFVGVRKTVEATEAEFKKLRQGLLEMSRNIPTSVNQLAKIEEIAGQMGIRGVANLNQFTETIAKMAFTTNLTEENASISFGRIANVMKEPIKNVEKMGSTVTALGNEMEANEAEITNFANRIAAAGSVAGLTTADIFGIGAAMTSVGIRAEEGGTAVQKVLFELKEQGLEGRDAFQAFVRMLEENSDDAGAILESMGLGGERVKRAFLALAEASGTLDKAMAISNESFIKGTALEQEFAKFKETSAGKTLLLKNAVNELAILLGDRMKPAYDFVVGGLTNFIQKTVDAEQKSKELTRTLRFLVEGPLGIAARMLGTMAGGGSFQEALDAGLLRSKEAAENAISSSQDTIGGAGGLGGGDSITTGDSLGGLQEQKNQEIGIIEQAEARKTKIVEENATVQNKINQILFKHKESLAEAAMKAAEAKRKAELVAEKEKAQMQVQINSTASQLVNQIAIASGSSTLKAVAIIVDAVVKAINIMLLATNPLLAILQIAVTAVSAANAISNLRQAEKALQASAGDIQAVTNVPRFADGVQNFSGGVALVGERGPELVTLPRGSNVTPNEAIGKNVEVHFHGQVNVRDEDDIRKIAVEVSTILDAERSRL